MRGCNNFYVGIAFITFDKNVQIQQEIYISHMQPIHVDPSRFLELNSAVCQDEKYQLWSKMGQILWVGRRSRPDVMLDASNLAWNLKYATVQTIHEANRIVYIRTSTWAETVLLWWSCSVMPHLEIFQTEAIKENTWMFWWKMVENSPHFLGRQRVSEDLCDMPL